MICTMADVGVLNLCPGICAPWHYKHWTVVSCLVTTITINLFCSKDRGDQNILSVTLLYHHYYCIEIKASSCFHSVFLKSHCLYNYFNIQYLIKVKLLFSALEFLSPPLKRPLKIFNRPLRFVLTHSRET